MDVVKDILDWFTENSRNLNESQKKEVYDLLNSLGGRLETQMGSSGQEHKPSHFLNVNRGDQKYHEVADKIDCKDAEFESKINRVTNIVNKETGYINGKLDTITREYNEQIEKLKNKVQDLEKKNNQRKREEKKVSDQDINRLAENLKDLMTGIVTEQRSFPSNSNPSYPQGPLPQNPSYTQGPPPPNPSYPQGPPPPYQPSPPMIPDLNLPYFPPPHIPSQFNSRPPFPHSQFGTSSSNPTPNHTNHQNVYRFNGNWSSAPNNYTNQGVGHSKPRFEKTFPRGNDDKFGGHVKKSYCSPHWKKYDHKNKEQGLKNEPQSTANVKSQYKSTSHDEQSNGDSNRGRSYHANRFKNHADRGKNKRFQQFGMNRPQNQDDGFESDTSVGSHVSFQNTREEFSHKVGHPHKLKGAPNKTQTPAGKNDDSNAFRHENMSDKDTSTTSGKSWKPARKENTSKTQRSCASSTTPNKCPQSSTKKTDSSELQKLKYPSKAVALREGIDIRKSLESPGMCLGKRNGVPVSRSVHCLEDIYNFEMEFGSCQVIRF